MFEVKQILVVNPKERFILVIEPYMMSLTDLLVGCPISERKVYYYGSVIEYPTEIARSVIQGIDLISRHSFKKIY